MYLTATSQPPATPRSQDREVIAYDGPFFEAALLKLQVHRSPSPNFSVLYAAVSESPDLPPRTMTRIAGDGVLHHIGDVNVTGHQRVTSRGGDHDTEDRGHVLSLDAAGDPSRPRHMTPEDSMVPPHHIVHGPLNFPSHRTRIATCSVPTILAQHTNPHPPTPHPILS